MEEIFLTDIEGINIGHAQDEMAGTGCTVVLAPKGASVGIDVRGGGPASRETELLNPLSSQKEIHAILLSGGSAFGLDSAGGVMKYLRENGIGYKTNFGIVPLVCASCIFDLGVGSPLAAPTQEMAYQACVNAQENITRQGNVGAGQGATVGKYNKAPYMMKAGLGSYALQCNKLQIGALAVVNAFGDVYDNKTHQIIAGMLTPDKTDFADTEKAMVENCMTVSNLLSENTTLGVIVTNAAFDKIQMSKIASMAQNGMARAISPVHTMSDGDTIYAMSIGNLTADINSVGTLAAKVMQQAIVNAVKKAQPIYGLKTASCIQK